MILSLLLILSAQADIADPGPETCTVEDKEQEGTTCVSCRTNRSAGEETDTGTEPTCGEQYAGTAYSYVCSTSGATVWTEVWCDGPPAERGCGGCATVGRTSTLSWVAGLGLLGLALGRRR